MRQSDGGPVIDVPVRRMDVEHNRITLVQQASVVWCLTKNCFIADEKWSVVPSEIVFGIPKETRPQQDCFISRLYIKQSEKTIPFCRGLYIFSTIFKNIFYWNNQLVRRVITEYPSTF